MAIRKKKTSNWIALFLIPILILSGIGFVVGFVYTYLAAGYLHGQDFMAKLSGYETREEMMERIIKEQS